MGTAAKVHIMIWFDFDLIYSFFIQGNHFSAEHWSPNGPCVTYIQLRHFKTVYIIDNMITFKHVIKDNKN